MKLSARQAALIATATTALAAAAVVGTDAFEWNVAPAGAAHSHAAESAGDIVVPDHMALSVADHIAL